jgi:hypothetical protein
MKLKRKTDDTKDNHTKRPKSGTDSESKNISYQVSNIIGPFDAQYKQDRLDFERKYQDYLKIRSQIESTQKKFADLGKAAEKASPTHREALNAQIVSLYKEQFEPLQKLKQQHTQLHQELKAIKQKVKDKEKLMANKQV